MQFAIPVDTIKALLLIAAKKDIRYYLKSVCIDVRATDSVAVVTDGHKLMAVSLEYIGNRCAPFVPGQYIIPRDVLDAFKPGNRAPVTVTINATARTVTLYGGGATVTAPLVDAQYPDWRRVVPLTCSGEVAQFNADYVGAFGKAHKLMGGKYSPAIVHNGNGAARVLLAGDTVGVLMPFRENDSTPKFENPDWLAAPAAPDTAAA
jgi:hypothetical protein